VVLFILGYVACFASGVLLGRWWAKRRATGIDLRGAHNTTVVLESSREGDKTSVVVFPENHDE
jgi:hypothetical protein